MFYACCAPSYAALADYVPEPIRRGSRIAPQKRVASLDTWKKANIQLGAVNLSNDPKGFVLTGKTTTSTPWKIERSAAEWGGQLFECDLDRNGTRDLISFTYTGACGIAPPGRLLIMLFEKNGYPHCYEMFGYFETNKEDVLTDVFSIGNSGPLIMQQQLIWVPANKEHSARHYWRHQLYKATNCKLEPWKGRRGGSIVPCYVYYTYKPNHRVAPNSAAIEAISKTDREEAEEVEVVLPTSRTK